jgi:hypothetical protein
MKVMRAISTKMMFRDMSTVGLAHGSATTASLMRKPTTSARPPTIKQVTVPDWNQSSLLPWSSPMEIRARPAQNNSIPPQSALARSWRLTPSRGVPSHVSTAMSAATTASCQ